jgi:hypothetical protein
MSMQGPSLGGFCRQSLDTLYKRSNVHKRIKYIDVKYNYMRDMFSQGKLKICKISSHDNLANMITKAVPIASLYN